MKDETGSGSGAGPDQPPRACADEEKIGERRRRAEALFRDRQRRDPPPLGGSDSLEALHGLQVHEIELGLHIEELSSARDEAEARFQQAQKMEAVGLLAAGVAHDFNNLLTTIFGNSYFLMEELAAGSPARSYCQEIRAAADLAASLSRQFMALGRGEPGPAQPIDPNSVLLSLVRMLRRLVGDNIKVKVDAHPSVWAVRMSSGHLEQIIMNLVVNARDAMPRGGHLTLTTANRIARKGRRLDPKVPTMPPGRYLCLQVRDTGMGMDAATLARIFEPFFTTKQAGRGTGLGLTAVKNIVTRYDGQISIDSEPGKGTTFRVYLPSLQAAAAALFPGTASASHKGGNERILLVEDNAGLKDVIKRTLSPKGYHVAAFGSAEEAEAQARRSKHPCDLLLTDIVLPGMDGVDLSQRLKAIWPALKIIYMSGYPGEAMGKVAGVSDTTYLEKPFPPDQLLRAVRQVLGTHQGEIF